nr:hypothetical protein [uncultured Enterococcus sp.]
MYEEQLTEFETLTPDTIFLFDGSDNASHSINPRNIVSDIVELSVFQEAYGEAIYDFSDVTSNFGLYADQTELANQTNQEFIEEGGEYIPIQTTEQMNKLLDGENAVALPETALPFIEEYAKHVPITYDWTFDEIGHEYAEYKANGKAFHMERAEMDITIDDVRPELVDRLMDGDIVLSAVYDEAVLQQLSPEAQHYWKSALSLTEELEETEGEASGKQEKLFDALINTYPKAVVQDMKEKSTGDSKENQLQEKKIAEESSDLDMSRLGQARRKLERLETELAGKFDQMYEHQRLTNGQPMNDKRNGRAWFNKQEKIDDSIRNLMQQIEEQKDRVEKYERHAEYKEMGMNKQGGLIMSIENIPRIKEEIEKSKVGESLFSRDTIRKYEKQLEILEAAKNQAEVAENNLSSHAKALIESGNLNQWKKNPMIYFVKDLKKVAFELTPEGDFQLAAKYQPVTADEKARVVELLSGKEEAKEGANMAYNEKQNTTEVDQQREDLSDLQSLEDSLSGSTKESSVMVDQEKSEALEVLEDSFKELADGEFYREMLKKYDLTNLGDIRKAQGEVDQQLQAHFEEQKNAAEIEKEMLNAYEEKEDERIQLQENFGIAEATNETPDRYFQVEFNEMNPRLGINRYQGEVVTSELIFEWQSFESAASSNVGHSKFFINEMINGEFITQHRLNVGEGLNNSMYDFLMQGAVSKKRAAEITNGRVVAGGRQQQSPTKEENEIEPGLNDLPTNSQEDQQLKNSNLHVLANSFNIEDGVRSYQEELVSPELLAELKILDNDCEAKGKTYEFLFGREVEGREEFVQLFVGEGLDENEHLYNQLEEMLSVSKQAEIADSSEQPATQMDYDGEVNQAVNEVLDVMAQKEEGTNEYLTRAEFDQALNNHFTRIEQLLSNRAAAVDSIEQPVLEQKPAFVKGLMENVKSEVARFKEDLLSKLSAFKEDPMYYVRDKVDSLRVRVKNTINSKRIERANKQIEKLVDKIENKYALEEKGERLESNRKGTEEVVKEVAEQTAEPIKRINEEQPEPVRTVEKEEPPIEVIEQSEDDPIKQIENLSNRLGLSITEKEKKKISQLTDKEKENLIQEMNEALPKEKEQEEVAAEEPEIEIA